MSCCVSDHGRALEGRRLSGRKKETIRCDLGVMQLTRRRTLLHPREPADPRALRHEVVDMHTREMYIRNMYANKTYTCLYIHSPEDHQCNAMGFQ